MRFCDAEQLHQQILSAFVGQQAEAQRGAAHARGARRDAEVARQRQRKSGLYGNAVDRGEREFVEAAHGSVESLGNGAQTVVGAECVVVSRRYSRNERFTAEFGVAIGLQVVAGAERAARCR